MNQEDHDFPAIGEEAPEEQPKARRKRQTRKPAEGPKKKTVTRKTRKKSAKQIAEERKAKEQKAREKAAKLPDKVEEIAAEDAPEGTEHPKHSVAYQDYNDGMMDDVDDFYKEKAGLQKSEEPVVAEQVPVKRVRNTKQTIPPSKKPKKLKANIRRKSEPKSRFHIGFTDDAPVTSRHIRGIDILLREKIWRKGEVKTEHAGQWVYGREYLLTRKQYEGLIEDIDKMRVRWMGKPSKNQDGTKKRGVGPGENYMRGDIITDELCQRWHGWEGEDRPLAEYIYVVEGHADVRAPGIPLSKMFPGRFEIYNEEDAVELNVAQQVSPH